MYISNKLKFRKYVQEQAFLSFFPFFLKESQKLIPSIKAKDLIFSDKVGIRSQLYNKKTQKLSSNFYNNLLKNIQKVNKEDIRRVSKKYLNPNYMRIVVTGKGIDILKGLENIYFMGRKLKVSYYDKYGNSTERPNF